MPHHLFVTLPLILLILHEVSSCSKDTKQSMACVQCPTFTSTLDELGRPILQKFPCDNEDQPTKCPISVQLISNNNGTYNATFSQEFQTNKEPIWCAKVSVRGNRNKVILKRCHRFGKTGLGCQDVGNLTVCHCNQYGCNDAMKDFHLFPYLIFWLSLSTSCSLIFNLILY